MTDDKNKNIENALKFVRTAKENSADIAILPECFNCPYGTSKIIFIKYSSIAQSFVKIKKNKFQLF